MDGVTSVSVGGDYIAAVKKDNSLWLVNGAAYVNDGTPEKIMDDVASVSAASHCIAAVKNDGSLWLWGKDYGFWQDSGASGAGLFADDGASEGHHL